MSELPKYNPDLPEAEGNYRDDPRFTEEVVEALKGPAIWEAPDGDTRVTVDDYWGSEEGSPYLEVSHGKEDPILVPLDELRFSRDRGRELRQAGVDLDYLGQEPVTAEYHPDYQGETDARFAERLDTDEAREKAAAYNTAGKAERRRIERRAEAEAASRFATETEAYGAAEEQAQERELEAVREEIAQGEAEGEKWTKRKRQKVEAEAEAAAVPTKRDIEEARFEHDLPMTFGERVRGTLRRGWRRFAEFMTGSEGSPQMEPSAEHRRTETSEPASAPEREPDNGTAEQETRLTKAVERLLDAEPDGDRLRGEAARWSAFLKSHGERPGTNEGAERVVEYTKEFEEAFAESPHSAELQDELREKQFDMIEHRARELSNGEVTARALEAAREWMLELVRSGRTGPHEETARNEAVDYVTSRMDAWKNGLFKGKRKWLTAGIIALGVVVPPVGLFVGATALQVGLVYEGARALAEAAPNMFKKGHEWIKGRARERRVRRQLRLA